MSAIAKFLGLLVVLLVAGGAAPAPECGPGEVKLSGRCVPATIFQNQSGHSALPSENSIVRPSGQKAKKHYKAAVVAGAPGELVPARVYLRSEDIPPPGVGAYGIFTLHGRPTIASRKRLLMACKSFLAYLPPQTELPKSVPLGDQMLTIWPLDDPSAAGATKDDCDFLLDGYALYAAESAMADAGRQGAKFSGRGPFLIGWSPSNTRGRPDKLVLVIDMSPYESQDSFDHAFMFWKQQIVENPALWRSGWSFEGVRLAVRDFADHYGSEIVSAVKLWIKQD